MRFSNASGNVLFLILVAVVLFAALSYAVTQSSRGTGSVSKETAQIHASQITQYPTLLKQEILRMNVKGSTLTDIRFAYNNIPAPANQFDWQNQMGYWNNDPENEIFNPAGGGVFFQIPDPKWCLDNQCSYTPFEGLWNFAVSGNTISGKKMLGVGTANADTIAILGPLPLETCNAINEGLGLGKPPQQDNNGTETYEAYPGEEVFCMELGAGVYWYLHTLIAY